MLKLRFSSILFLFALVILVRPSPAWAQQQPTGLVFTSTHNIPNYTVNDQAFPGNTTRIANIGNGAGMTVEVKYKASNHCPDYSNQDDDSTGTITLDGNGQHSYAFTHWEVPTFFDVHKIRNVAGGPSLDVGHVCYQLHYPHPM